MTDDDKAMGRMTGEQPTVEKDGLGARLLYTLIIAVLLSLAGTALTVATVVQLVILLTNQGRANERLAEFGTSLGIWIAKAARYQTAASEVKPWPWTELD